MESTTCKCGAPRRPNGQRNCHKCHAAATRAWRARTKLTPLQRMKMNARSYAKVYIKRGKLIRQPCEICATPKTEPHHDDYSKPLAVRWLCRQHHLDHHRSTAG